MNQQAQGTDTVVLGSGYKDARALTAALVERLERSLADGQLDLPSLPEVALKIRRALADEDVSVGEIARLLGTDPALAARTLRVANSAMFYRGSRPITSLSGAVSQLGQKMVRNVALSFAAQQVFIGCGNRTLRDLVGAVWRHSVHAAVVAHMLARVRTKLNADEAFLAGLLHEVGKLYIFMRAKDDVETLAGDAQARAAMPAVGQRRDVAEQLPGVADAGFQSVLAAWHPRIGRAVIEAWQLPGELAAAVGDHESCTLAASDPPTMTAVVAVANYLVEHSEAAVADADFHSKVPSFGSLAMDKATFDWLIRAAEVDVRLMTIAFGV
jgi:HD-like signal output (HDOD) protein